MAPYLASLALFLAGVALGVALEDWRLARALDRLTQRLEPTGAAWRASRVATLNLTERVL